MAITKTHPIKSTLKAAIDYICNPAKTDGSLWVSGFSCEWMANNLHTNSAASGRELRCSFGMAIFINSSSFYHFLLNLKIRSVYKELHADRETGC